jgi:tRNA (mo5U34)-methyltransferase
MSIQLPPYKMLDFSDCFKALEQSQLSSIVGLLEDALEEAFEHYTHGELDKWQQLIDALPSYSQELISFSDTVSVQGEPLTTDALDALKAQLMQLHPWRKGPYNIQGLEIDTEWRSDFKWQRIAPHLGSFENLSVLDIGCGNGYHLWRMLEQGAKIALGIDPSQKFLAQFLAIKHFMGNHPAFLLPIGIELMPPLAVFDRVFSMGVLYHRRSPIEHIQQLKSFVKPGGKLILETIVIEGDEQAVLVPKGRYAQMRNVWFLPSAKALALWMARCDLKNIQIIDETPTSFKEQRATDWMTFHSLENYLDAEDPSKTIEGYPAPIRATIVADV